MKTYLVTVLMTSFLTSNILGKSQKGEPVIYVKQRTVFDGSKYEERKNTILEAFGDLSAEKKKDRLIWKFKSDDGFESFKIELSDKEASFEYRSHKSEESVNYHKFREVLDKFINGKS